MTIPARVSLTFDDALDDHIDIAAPRLEAHGFRGTFYLPIRTATVTARAEDWRGLAERGHELGNHSLFHPGPRSRSWVDPGSAIEDYSVARMRQELAVANRVLGLLDGRSQRTYAYPCDLTEVGRAGLPRRVLRRVGLGLAADRLFERYPGLDIGGTRRDYAHVLPDLFVAARAGPGEPATADPFRVPCLTGDVGTLAELVRPFEAALDRTDWVVFAFHGLGGHRTLNCDLGAFDAFLSYLQEREDIVVETFVNAARARQAE